MAQAAQAGLRAQNAIGLVAIQLDVFTRSSL